MDYIFADEHFKLLGEKAVWHGASKSLLLSDVHVDKIHHFRKNGIPLPYQARNSSLDALTQMAHTYKPQRIVFLGDLFHSTSNEGTKAFLQWRLEYSTVEMILVRGNHDLIEPVSLVQHGIYDLESFDLCGITCTHHPMDVTQANVYNMSGHIHPAVRLSGKAKQSLTLPCFAFTQQTAILPSFGYFTGLHVLRQPEKYDIFCILDKKVVRITTKV